MLNLSIAALLILAAAVYIARPDRLTIVDADSGRVYAKWPIKSGEEFGIEFIHSVNNSPVLETFVAEGSSIRAVRTRFYSYGAGMPTELEAGQVLSRDGEALVISGFSAVYRELNYIVGTVSDHILTIREESVSLRDLCGRNAHIRILVR
ncbi:hypothetical protein FACS1894200_07760 [Spirochaetia bacterium]|nr:hypothetical protein FACS1894200_07760 [Spirochaetia bacterium]